MHAHRRMKLAISQISYRAISVPPPPPPATTRMHAYQIVFTAL